MIAVWRLVRERYAASAFSGDGARDYGGRWNHEGVAVVYTSGNLSLAALELLVHLQRVPLERPLVALRAEVPDDVVVGTLGAGALPADWRGQPPSPSTMAIGSTWARAGATVALRVPSVIVPQEWNYLLNPAHADFARVRVGAPQPFHFDPRLWR